MNRSFFCEYEGCGAPIPYAGVGRPPKYCAACVDEHNINGQAGRRVDVPVGPKTDHAIAKTVGDMQFLQGVSRYAGRVQRLAIGLATVSDPQQAAALAGVVTKDETELAELAALAMADDYKPLRELQPAAMTSLIMQTIALLLANARESAAAGGSPSQTIAGIKGLAQSLEILTGGASSVYGDLTIVFPGMSEDP